MRNVSLSPRITRITRKNSVSLILLIKNLCSFCSYVKKLIKIRADTRDTWRHITLDIRTKEHSPFCSYVQKTDKIYAQIPVIRGDKKSIETWFSPTIQSFLTQVSKIVIPIKRLAQFLASVINNVRRTNRLLQHLLQVV